MVDRLYALSLLCGLLGVTAYSTDFPSASAVLQDWHLENSCDHCSKRGGDECTQNTPNATTFGVLAGKGMQHTTNNVNPSSSDCHACATSGHLVFNKAVLYGNFSVRAKWFPGDEQAVSTATGVHQRTPSVGWLS